MNRTDKIMFLTNHFGTWLATQGPSRPDDDAINYVLDRIMEDPDEVEQVGWSAQYRAGLR
jgi:hypothetical protein